MPHIKVEPFDTNIIDKLNSSLVEFRAINNKNEIVLVNKNSNRVFLDIVKRDKEYLIKPNVITKGSNSELLKDILNSFAKEFNLKVLHSNTIVKNQKAIKTSPYLKSIEDFYNFKTEFKNIELEVGFGSGRHILYRAKNKPDTLFIGIEIHTPSIEQVLKQIELKNIKNIILVKYDARLLLEMLHSNILDKIYVHFPVPWDKKPHRRVINKNFINQALRVLKKGASLELRTDSINYYHYSLDVFSEPKMAKFSVDKNIDIEVISKYEARWKRMQKDIYTLNLFALNNSKEQDLNIDFEFENIEFADSFPLITIKKEDYFVHISRVYSSTTDDTKVLEVSFGSFNMPERKMLILSKDKIEYLPTPPVKSMANYKAHKLIKEVIDGKYN